MKRPALARAEMPTRRIVKPPGHPMLRVALPPQQAPHSLLRGTTFRQSHLQPVPGRCPKVPPHRASPIAQEVRPLRRPPKLFGRCPKVPPHQAALGLTATQSPLYPAGPSTSYAINGSGHRRYPTRPHSLTSSAAAELEDDEPDSSSSLPPWSHPSLGTVGCPGQHSLQMRL